MKAAHKIFNKYKAKTSKNWSKALTKAWSWAKNVIGTKDSIRVWSPRKGFGRLYFSDNSYIQVILGKHYYVNITKVVGEMATKASSTIDIQNYSIKLA